MIFMDVHRFSWIFRDIHGFTSIFMDLNGSGTRMSDILCRPVASCGILRRPVASACAGLDPANMKISDSGGLDAGRWKDSNGLEEVKEATEALEGMGGGDWKKFPHARASGARRISRH